MKPERNSPCPCGSGKKFKKCCLGKFEPNLVVSTTPAKGEPEPTHVEINQLVALFNAGNHVELESQALLLVEQHPASGFVWMALGAALQAQGKNALPAMQKAAKLLPNDAEAHNNLGSTLKDLGQLDDAVASYRRALEFKPDYAEAYNNLGSALLDLGQLDDAVASCRRALELKPDYAEAHNNLGSALLNLEQLDNAVASLRRALEFKPDYAEAHNNLGSALLGLRQLDDAAASFRRALEFKPDLAMAHNNLGSALLDLGQLDDAAASFRRALELKPDLVMAHSNLAFLFNKQGNQVMAWDSIKRSLRIKGTDEAKRIFIACVKNLNFTSNDSETREYIVRALAEPWENFAQLTRVSIRLIMLDPNIGRCVTRAVEAWPLRLSAQDLFGTDGLSTIASDLLLCTLLNSVPINDIGMERFLTMARRSLLETAIGMTASDSDVGVALKFYSGLAQQCFINEYVFSYTDEEIQKASNLKDSLIEALEAKAQVPILWPLAVAAYFPLYSLALATRLLEMPWTEEVASVLVQQIREPEEEQQLRRTISRLTDIENEVSLLVQKQYEENPYPRWIRTPVGKPLAVDLVLRSLFPLATFQPLGKRDYLDMLIAGCGTGHHPIVEAQRFQSARVLAVDLSISSLGYAKRKTQELGLTSIEYAQADLLKLGSLGRSFDVIESCGVLHHLADPWAGWRVLLSLLRPGGFMRLGFYSEVARRDVVRVRSFIAEQGYGATANEIRQCRQELIDLDKSEDFGTTLKSPDFFSTSACRDLLFHVQEHRMTLTGIDAFLKENDLVFLGFEIDAEGIHDYKRRFPDDHAATNLDQWQIFENENPDTFGGMYQFWIQKAE